MTPLHHIGEFVRDALLAIPLWAVRALFVGSLAVLLVWVLRLPRTATTPPDGARRWDQNLKGPAAIAVAIPLLIYSLL